MNHLAEKSQHPPHLQLRYGWPINREEFHISSPSLGSFLRLITAVYDEYLEIDRDVFWEYEVEIWDEDGFVSMFSISDFYDGVYHYLQHIYDYPLMSWWGAFHSKPGPMWKLYEFDNEEVEDVFDRLVEVFGED